MDPLLIKAFQSLVPIEQELVAAIVFALAEKDLQISNLIKRVAQTAENKQ